MCGGVSCLQFFINLSCVSVMKRESDHRNLEASSRLLLVSSSDPTADVSGDFNDEIKFISWHNN